MDNALNVNANDNDDEVTSSSVVDTVLIGNNPQFHTLCRDLRENRPGLLRANVCIPLLESDEHLTEFVTSMGHNQTVQSLTMIIPEDFCMEPEDARRLGDMMADAQSAIKNLVLSNFSARTSALHVFWQGVARSPSLSVLAVHGVKVSSSGIEEARQIPSLQGLILDKCTFDAEGSEAFLGLLEQQDSPVVMVRIDCCIMEADVKMRIAKCLAERSTLPAFSFDDTALDDHCTDAFAQAIVKNANLRHVEFHSCSDRTLTVLTKAIVENTNIMSAKVTTSSHNNNNKTGSSSRSSIALAASCQQQINHYTTLNRAGRKFLREDVPRPNAESIEACWFRILLEHHQECNLAFPLLRDYPTIFLRALGLWDCRRTATATSTEEGDFYTRTSAKRTVPEDDNGSVERSGENESLVVKRAKC